MTTLLKHKTAISVLTIMLSASWLSACGGSSSSDTHLNNTGNGNVPATTNTSGSTTTTTPPVTIKSCSNGAVNFPECSFAAYSQVPALTYPNDSAASAFIQALNTMRTQAGLGLFAQDAALDRAAQAHAHYLSVNLDSTMTGIDPTTGLLYGHSENVAKPGFTGARPTDRSRFAGYVGVAIEIASVDDKNSPFAVPDNAAAGLEGFHALMNTVYHRESMLSDQVQDIGIGYALPSDLVVDLGTRGKLTGLLPGQLAIYPADGTINPYPAFEPGTEAPNPLANMRSAPAVVGAPISVYAGDQRDLNVTTFQLILNSTGAIVNSKLITKKTDVSGYSGASFAHLLPMQPLELDQSYSVLLQGTIDGKAFSKNWSFSTPKPVCQLRGTVPAQLHPGDQMVISFNVPSHHPIMESSAIGIQGVKVTLGGSSSLIVSIPKTAVLAPTGSVMSFRVTDKFYPNAAPFQLRIPISN